VRIPLFRGTKRWVIVVSATLLSSLLLSACDERTPSVLNTFGPVAQKEATLFWIILGVATFIFVAVEGILIYSIVRYRERPNTPNPRQIHGNNTIEVIWTVAPSIFLFFVLGVTIYTMFGLSDLGGGNKLEVRVVAHQWWWEFDYPGYHIATADSLHIPANTIIQADLVSKDVIPGHNNQLFFKADSDAVGHTFPGACAEFCGAQHATCALM
jgi:cytochrome c oxidase subunit II